MNGRLIMASAFGKRDQLYSVRQTCKETECVCLQICLSNSGFGAKFKRLGRTGQYVETLVGQLLIGGLQEFVVMF